MKKILSFIILMLISLFTLSSCVGVTNPPNPNDPGNGDTPVDPNVPEEDLITYKVSLYRNSQIWIPNMEIYAIFVNDISVTEVLIDDFYGTAEFKGDGDYDVHLSDVPTGYTYDPNMYSVDPQHTEIIIDLYPILDFDSGNGSGPYNPDAYDISKVGYYKVELDSINDRKYFHFLPVQSGEYIIESMCDIHADDIDPVGIKYSGTEQFISEEYGKEVYDDGGISKDAGFTTNFKFTITFDVTELNVARVFAIEAESKIEQYPCTVYFKIQWNDDYSKGPAFNPRIIEPKEANESVTPIDSGTLTWMSDLNNHVLDIRKCKYNPNNGLWYYYDEQYKDQPNFEEDWGIKLVAPASDTINIPSINMTFSQALGYQPTYLCLHDENDERVCYDYFLYGDGPLYDENGDKVVYEGVSYSDYARGGFVYVTNEIMEFYQLLSNNKEYFKDGEGWAEGNKYDDEPNGAGDEGELVYGGVSSGQDDQWLFACAIYLS